MKKAINELNCTGLSVCPSTNLCDRHVRLVDGLEIGESDCVEMEGVSARSSCKREMHLKRGGVHRGHLFLP